MPGIQTVLTGAAKAEETMSPIVAAAQVILIIKMKSQSYANLVKDAALKDRFIACIRGSVAEFAIPDGNSPATANAVDFLACLARVAPVDTLPGCLKPGSQQMGTWTYGWQESFVPCRLARIGAGYRPGSFRYCA